jgi:hypothetical protein
MYQSIMRYVQTKWRRALEESSSLRRRMAAHARERGMSAIADAYDAHARESETRVKAVRGILVNDAAGRRLQVSSKRFPLPG